jgi:TrmH family RNA methyltransferase
MIIHELITSINNKRIKNIIQLQKSRERKNQEIFVIEGIKEILKAIKYNYEFQTIFYCKEIAIVKNLNEIFSKNANSEIVEVSKAVYEKIAYRENSGGVVALAKPKNHKLEDIHLSDNPLVLVIERVEKPGNLGAILRTADAAGIEAVIVCDNQTDIYNPNVIRASLGCVFTVPIVVTESKFAISWLKANKINIYSTHLDAAIPYNSVDFTKKTAIVFGAESVGISDLWTKNSTKNIIIQMKGEADSLNVSTSSAIIIFEAVRQRGF